MEGDANQNASENVLIRTLLQNTRLQHAEVGTAEP